MAAVGAPRCEDAEALDQNKTVRGNPFARKAQWLVSAVIGTYRVVNDQLSAKTSRT